MKTVSHGRLWVGLTLIGLIWAITLGVEFRSAIHSEPLIDKIGSGTPEPAFDNPDQLVPVGFACRDKEPSDQEIRDMVDEVIGQVLGPEGLASLVKPGDKVVIKVNNVGPYLGRKGEKGRGVITDPRIVRYVAEKVRAIIGFEGTADLKVADAVFYANANPSLKSDKKSFYWARLERNGNNQVDPEDIGYDGDADGFLDGGSRARLVNLDSIDSSHRLLAKVRVAGSPDLTVCLPEFLRTKREAKGSGEYCDILIGLPVFKSHGLVGVTGALKLHYGFRPALNMLGDSGRLNHSGLYWDFSGIHNKQKLFNYLCAEHQVRTYDLTIMDCLTGNRRGPLNPGSGSTSTVDNQRVDYILTHAFLASRDPVAVDTVETALAGYERSSVGLLETARLNGLGTDQLGLIRLFGWDSFGRHRQRLSEQYGSKGLYPFEDKWGGARKLANVQSLTKVELGEVYQVRDKIYAFKYSIQSNGEGDSVLSRVDLIVNGRLAACRNRNIARQGMFEFSPPSGSKDVVTYKVAVWDDIFNCTLSEEKVFHQ